MKNFIIIFLLSFTALFSQVNTEEMRKFGIENGWHHSAGFNFGLNKGNTELLSIGANYRTDYMKDKFGTFMVGSVNYQESENQKILYKGFLHLRGMYDIFSRTQVESFLQKEFNEFILLNDRNLAGAGLRFNPLKLGSTSDTTTAFRLFTGFGMMFENESYDVTEDPNKNLVRSTNYITMEWKINEIFSLSTITYYQFALTDLQDYRILNDSSLQFKISDAFSFNFTVSYRYDNNPQTDVKKYDLALTNGIAVIF